MQDKKFHLQAPFSIAGDQGQAIDTLLQNLSHKKEEQVLLGVTGSGKTFTMANVIARLNRPTLIISHNKTLAAQLYQEFRDFFPNNAVSYFVSYYDYYQPEAYIPTTDTYIEKETEINEEIDKLRLSATANLLSRPDNIVIASVSAIYNIGSPREYGMFVLELREGVKITRDSMFERLTQLQYVRNDWGFHRGTFRVRGAHIDIFPSYEDTCLRLTMSDTLVQHIERLDPLTGKKIEDLPIVVIYPSKHFMTNPSTYKEVFAQIEQDMEEQVARFTKQKKFIEAQRIQERVTHDLEMIREVGYVNGIENYSRYFEKRKPGDPPYSLFDYFKESQERFFPGKEKARQDWLLFVDESHMTIPQIRGMYHGDRSRKQTLIDYGFRLPSALDNRPMMFDEFLRRIPHTIYVSATPDAWEVERSEHHVVEQLVRPTGLVDPTISVRPVEGQIEDLIKEVQTRVARHERTLVTTLTKRMAEDLTDYLKKLDIRVQYIHADVLTLERNDILTNLRKGAFDVLVGVNLLREGLDLPEVSLVAILDADKEGFLRNTTSLIQTMGRAARHKEGHVILYANVMTKSLKQAISEGERRRAIQIAYNQTHHITPTSIHKPIRNALVDPKDQPKMDEFRKGDRHALEAMTPKDKVAYIKKLRKEMTRASKDMNFELAAEIRDLIASLQ